MDIQSKLTGSEEDVNGVIIGEITFPYEFWQNGVRIDKGHFASDEEAASWFRTRHPGAYQQGAEMRVFDRRNE